jgi:MFS family permease
VTRRDENRQPKRFFYGYVIVLCSFLIVVVAEGTMYSFGIFFEPLLKEFGWNRTMTAGAFSLAGILQLPLAALAGRLLDRFGPRWVLSACGAFLGGSIFLMSLCSSLWHLYLFCGVLWAVGMALYWIPLISVAPRWFVKRRALMMGVITSGIGVGQLTLPLLANWLISVSSWRNSYLILSLISGGVVIGCAQFLRLDPSQMGLSPYGGEEKQEEDEAAQEQEGFSTPQALATWQFWMFCLMYFCWAYCLTTMSVHSVIHAIGCGMSGAAAAKILAIIGVMGILGRLGFGRLADRIGLRPVLVVSFALMAVGFSCLLLGCEPWMIYLYAAVVGFSYGTIEVLQSPLMAELFGLKALGTITGAAYAFSSVGFMLGPVAGGYIYDTAGSYNAAFTICVVLALIGMVANALLKPPEGAGTKLASAAG